MTASLTAAHKHVLAIDLGTSGPKVAVVQDTGRIMAATVRSNDMHLLPGGGAEQDAYQWWQSVRDAGRHVVRESGVAKESIRAVGVTSQWSVVVPVDANGEPTMNAVSWLDTRGAPYGRRVSSGFPSIQGYGLAKLVKWIRLAGSPPTRTGADSLAHMLFVQHERPDVYRRTFKFLEPMDFINLKLTGKFAASQVTAMPMLLTDNRNADCRSYDPSLVAFSGLDPAKLPELLPNDGFLGPVLPSVAEDLGLAPGTPVIMGAGDNHTAAIGAGAVRDYEAVIVLGTSGFLSAHVPRKKTDVIHFIGTVPSPFRNRHLIFAEQGGAGRVVDAYLTAHVYSGDGSGSAKLPPDAHDRMNALAESAPVGSDGVLFLPWFGGTLSPHEDPLARGGFVNLSYRTTRAHLMRAVLEGLSFNLRWLLQAVQRFMGRRVPELRLAGGGAQSDVWAQILADVSGVPIHQLADPRNGNVRGIAFLAFHRLGIVSVDELSDWLVVRRIVQPRAEVQETYDRMFRQFVSCRKRLAPVFHGLNHA